MKKFEPGRTVFHECGDTAIMLQETEEGWEVYYRKPGYPFIFAFGVEPTNGPELFWLAEENVDKYADLFE